MQCPMPQHGCVSAGSAARRPATSPVPLRCRAGTRVFARPVPTLLQTSRRTSTARAPSACSGGSGRPARRDRSRRRQAARSPHARARAGPQLLLVVRADDRARLAPARALRCTGVAVATSAHAGGRQRERAGAATRRRSWPDAVAVSRIQAPLTVARSGTRTPAPRACRRRQHRRPAPGHSSARP